MQHQQLKTNLENCCYSHIKKTVTTTKNPPTQCSTSVGKRIGLFVLDREAKSRKESEINKIYLSISITCIFVHTDIFPIEKM